MDTRRKFDAECREVAVVSVVVAADAGMATAAVRAAAPTTTPHTAHRRAREGGDGVLGESERAELVRLRFPSYRGDIAKEETAMDTRRKFDAECREVAVVSVVVAADAGMATAAVRAAAPTTTPHTAHRRGHWGGTRGVGREWQAPGRSAPRAGQVPASARGRAGLCLLFPRQNPSQPRVASTCCSESSRRGGCSAKFWNACSRQRSRWRTSGPRAHPARTCRGRFRGPTACRRC